MFGFKSKQSTLLAPISGTSVSLAEVPDPVFSEKMLGDGAAIIPENGVVVSPVDGTIADVTETLHAYCIESDDGLEILIHIGINTVELKGEGFQAFVKNGQKVNAGEKLAEVDLKLVQEKGYPIVTPVLITNPDSLKSMEPSYGFVKSGESCLIAYRK